MNTDAISESRRFFQKVYTWMFAGLIVSGLTAYFVSVTPALYKPIIGNSLLFFGICIGQIAIVVALAGFIKKISATAALFMFFLYCVVTGLTLSVIFLAYTLQSIGVVFFISAGMFGAMSIYGMVTKTDLTRMGQVLVMGLFGIIIAMIVNIFLKSNVTDIIISILGVIIFTGLTAYDTQKIRKFNIIGNEGTPEDLKESVVGALALYLDFINLFLFLLRLFGRRK